MAKYIKGKDGKFKGSIGDGKTRVPTAAQTPASLKGSLESVQQVTYGRAPIAFPEFTLSYDPIAESNRLTYAMGKGGSFSERRERKKIRKELEALFGPIDWKAVQPATDIPDFFAPPVDNGDLFGGHYTPAPEPVTAPAPVQKARQSGTDRDMLQVLSGRTGTLWLRVADEGEKQFVHSGTVRMLFERIGSPSVAPNSEWYHKEHVLIQYGTHARRYDIDDVSFSPTDR